MRTSVSIAAALVLVAFVVFTARAQEPAAEAQPPDGGGAAVGDVLQPVRPTPSGEAPVSPSKTVGEQGAGSRPDGTSGAEEPVTWALVPKDGKLVVAMRPPEAQKMPRNVVEAYVAAALAGQTDQAATLAEAGKITEDRRTIQRMREILAAKSLRIETVRTAEEDGLAVAVSETVKLTEADPDGLQQGRLLFVLTRFGGKWFVSNFGFESEHSALRDLEKFRRKYSDAKDDPPRDPVDAGYSSQPPAAGRSSGDLRVFSLEHAEAGEAAAILRELYGHVAVSADERLNVIIVRGGSREDLSEVEALLKNLDRPNPDRSEAPSPPRYHATPGRSLADWQPQATTLREQYRQFEQQAARLAQQYRDLPTKATRDAGDAEALKRQLTEAVNKAFEARQELQRAELDALCRRLARIEQQIAARERIKGAIVDRRVEELINPDVRWEPEADTSASAPNAAQAELKPAKVSAEKPHADAGDEDARAGGARIENPAKFVWDVLGVKLRPLSRDELPNHRYRGGMLVTEIRKDSPAATAKFGADDIIVGIDRWETTSVEQVAFVLDRLDLDNKPNHPRDVKLYLLRDGNTLYAMLRLPHRGPHEANQAD